MEPKVHFYLDRAISKSKFKELSLDQKKEVERIIKTKRLQVWVSLSFLKYDRVKVYTGERIEQVYWDNDKQRVNPIKYKYGAYDFNQWLNRIEEEVITEVRTRFRFNQKEAPTKRNISALIKSIIANSREKQIDKKAPSILTYFEQFRDKNKAEWAPGFTAILNSTIEHINNFQQWRGVPLTPVENYNAVWREFKEYLIEANLNNSTANKHCKIFRRLLNHLHDIGIISDINFKDLPPFKNIESFRIALKEGEVEKLANFKFTHNYLNKARDLMLVQIFSGQRVSDLPQVLEQIKSGGQIHVFQKKGKKRITIPSYPLLEKHLKAVEKRHPKGLEAISEQKYRDYIKQCCKDAGIDKKHTWVVLKGNKETTFSEPRYNLVTTHTCRRTFATLAKKRGVSDKAIMAITGHASHKIFLEYIRVDDEDVSLEFTEKMR